MHSIELAQRLMLDLDEQDLSLVTANARAAIVDAMNCGLQRFQAASANHWKEKSTGIYLKAPIAITLDLTQGSNSFTGFTPDDDQLYCTLVIDGDTIQHRIDSTTALLDPYTGTSGTKNAMLYYDAYVFNEPVERLVTDPVDLENTYYNLCKIQKNYVNHYGYRYYSRRIGSVYRYWMEPNARNRNRQGLFIFRTECLPDREYRYRCTVQMGMLKVSFQDLINPIDIPVRDDMIEAYLLPMIRADLSTNMLWKNNENKQEIQSRGRDAEQRLHTFSLNTMSPQNNKVGTPRGF